MQTKKLLAISIIFLFLSSCATINKKDIEEGISSGRSRTLDKIGNYYQKLLDNSFVEKSQQELMNIFSEHVDTTKYGAENLDTLKRQLNTKITQFNLLKKYYATYESLESLNGKELRLAEDTIATFYKEFLKVGEISDSVAYIAYEINRLQDSVLNYKSVHPNIALFQDSVKSDILLLQRFAKQTDSEQAKNRYDEIVQNIPFNLKKALQNLEPLMHKAVGGRKIAYHADVMYRLTQIYYAVWDSEEVTVKRIEEVFDKFDKRIEKLPNSIFDATKLSADLQQPYSDLNILVDLYKAKMKDRIRQSKKSIDTEIQDITTAMDLLIKINNELAKDKFLNSDLVDRIGDLKAVLDKKQ